MGTTETSTNSTISYVTPNEKAHQLMQNGKTGRRKEKLKAQKHTESENNDLSLTFTMRTERNH